MMLILMNTDSRIKYAKYLCAFVIHSANNYETFPKKLCCTEINFVISDKDKNPRAVAQQIIEFKTISQKCRAKTRKRRHRRQLIPIQRFIIRRRFLFSPGIRRLKDT
jgi:hypothetical protein